MRKYIPASFQPTIRQDWAGILSYISDQEKVEILTAIFKYPTVECSSKFWLETIKPDLDLQYENFKRSCEAKSRGIRNRWGKISIRDVEDMNNRCIRYVIDTKSKSKSKSIGIDKSKDESKEDKNMENGKIYNNFIPPTLEEVLDYARKQDEMKGCGCYACSDNEAIQFWLKCQNNHWKECNEYKTPICDWEEVLKHRNDKKYLLCVDVDKVAEYWNILADGYGLGKINSGDITGKKLDNCSKLLVEIICGLIVNPETKDVVMEQLEKREYDLWRWAMYRLDIRLSKSRYLRGETEHRNRLDISFLLNENNFKELVSPNSEKYIDRE